MEIILNLNKSLEEKYEEIKQKYDSIQSEINTIYEEFRENSYPKSLDDLIKETNELQSQLQFLAGKLSILRQLVRLSKK